MDTKENVRETERKTGYAADIIEAQSSATKFLKLIIIILLAIILVQGIYHEYQWSQFDTVVVDSSDGGNANYIGNDGDINNYGESGSTQEKEQSEIE